MGAYATDVVEKLWPTNYGGRGTPYLSEGGFNIRDQYGNFSAPPLGYLWDFAKRANVTVRSYGEFVSWRRRGGEVRADVPGTGRTGPSRVSAVRFECAGPGSAPTSGSRNSALRTRRQAAAALNHPARQRSHERHVARLPNASRDGRGQRSRPRPHRRGDYAQPLLEGIGDLRARRRRAEWARPRRCASIGAAVDQPVFAATSRSTARSIRRRPCFGRWS